MQVLRVLHEVSEIGWLVWLLLLKRRRVRFFRWRLEFLLLLSDSEGFLLFWLGGSCCGRCGCLCFLFLHLWGQLLFFQLFSAFNRDFLRLFYLLFLFWFSCFSLKFFNINHLHFLGLLFFDFTSFLWVFKLLFLEVFSTNHYRFSGLLLRLFYFLFFFLFSHINNRVIACSSWTWLSFLNRLFSFWSTDCDLWLDLFYWLVNGYVRSCRLSSLLFHGCVFIEWIFSDCIDSALGVGIVFIGYGDFGVPVFRRRFLGQSRSFSIKNPFDFADDGEGVMLESLLI